MQKKDFPNIFTFSGKVYTIYIQSFRIGTQSLCNGTVNIQSILNNKIVQKGES